MDPSQFSQRLWKIVEKLLERPEMGAVLLTKRVKLDQDDLFLVIRRKIVQHTHITYRIQNADRRIHILSNSHNR